MPPASNKRKAAAPPPDSGRTSSAAPAGAAGARQRKEDKERGLDPKEVKDFLKFLQRRDKLGAEFFTDVERQQWDEWLDNQPARATEAGDAAVLLPVRMPPKCVPKAAAGSSSTSSGPSTQQEIIAYSNAGGRQFQTADRQRQHAASKPLMSADVPLNSTVAVRRTAPDSGAVQPGGYGTLFYVGDVIETTCRPTSRRGGGETTHSLPHAARARLTIL